MWAFALPGFANPERIAYFNQFIKRRTGLAAAKATPLHLVKK
jgi:hypothetical protein